MLYICVCKKVNHEQNDRQQPEEEQETATMTATGTPEPEDDQVCVPFIFFLHSFPLHATDFNSRGCQGKKEGGEFCRE